MGLGTRHLGAGVIDIFDRQGQFRLMAIGTAPLLGPALGENPTPWHCGCLKERHDLVIEQRGCGSRGRAIEELGKGHMTGGIHNGLRIDPLDALSRPALERILGPTILGSFTRKLSLGFFVPRRLLSGRQLGFRHNRAFPGNLGFECLPALLRFSKPLRFLPPVPLLPR